MDWAIELFVRGLKGGDETSTLQKWLKKQCKAIKEGNCSLDDLNQAHAFLSLKMDDGRTILEHLEESSPYIQNQLEVKDISFDQIREAFLTAIKGETALKSFIRTKDKNGETLENWLRRNHVLAKNLSRKTHFCKCSHPDNKNGSVMAHGEGRADGFLRTGNVRGVPDDWEGNATYSPLGTFLSLKMDDGRTIWEHLEESSVYIRNMLKIKDIPFDQIREAFLAATKNKEPKSTEGRIKQVFFPVGDDYHLLSILTPLGIAMCQSERIQKEAKASWYNRGKHDDFQRGYTIVPHVRIGYGGEKPQNISLGNVRYRYGIQLLPCLPPVLPGRTIRLPQKDFFTETLRLKYFEESFSNLHGIIVRKANNKYIRDKQNGIILHEIFARIIYCARTVRQQWNGWSLAENYSILPEEQKIWLDDARMEDRMKDDAWIAKIIHGSSRWFVAAYRDKFGIVLGDVGMDHFKSIAEEMRGDLM